MQYLKESQAQLPSVAVIIPFYNGASWIERAIKSVLAQSIQPDEFIIVNDGSSTEQRNMLGIFAEKYPFKIIDKTNGGQGSARNAGVAASKSDFISLLDQDDFYLPNHIKDLLSILPDDDPRLGYVYADLCEADEGGNIICSNMLQRLSAKHPKRGHVAQLLADDMFVLPSASLILRSAFEAVSGFDEQFTGYEDDDLFLRLFRAGYTNYFLDKPVTVWCIHSASTSWSVKMSRSRFRYFKKLLQLYPDEPKRQLYYFKDCLMPRFGREILLDALRAAKNNSKDREEISQILNDYVNIVARHPDVRKLKKIKLKVAALVLTKMSPAAVRVLSFMVRRLAFTRLLAVKVLRG